MNPGTQTFTLGSVLNGISKTLGVANQVIPLWQQTKPLFKNARVAYDIIKGGKKPTKANVKKVNNETIPTKKAIINNSPQFFI